MVGSGIDVATDVNVTVAVAVDFSALIRSVIKSTNGIGKASGSDPSRCG
jgi:hypothetical protein